MTSTEIVVRPETLPTIIPDLPQDAQEFLTAYDPGNTDPFITRIRRICTMDVGLLQNDPRLKDIHIRQAQEFQAFIQETGRVIIDNMALLSFLIAFVADKGLHTYLEVHDLSQWLEQIGISSEMRKMAEKIYRIWPYLYKIGLKPSDLTDTRLTNPVTIKSIQGMQKQEPFQIQALEKQIVQELHPELLAIPVQQQSTKDLPALMEQLPASERKAIYEQAQERYVQAARQKIEDIRTLSPGDLIKKKQEEHGELVRPLLILDGVVLHHRPDNTMHLSWKAGSVVITADQAPSYTHGRVSLRFRIDGELHALSSIGEQAEIALSPQYSDDERY